MQFPKTGSLRGYNVVMCLTGSHATNFLFATVIFARPLSVGWTVAFRTDPASHRDCNPKRSSARPTAESSKQSRNAVIAEPVLSHSLVRSGFAAAPSQAARI